MVVMSHEFLLFVALGLAVIALCLALGERDEQHRDARRRNQARPRR